MLVLADLVGSAWLALSVPAPTTVPDYALQAEVLYHLEIGAVCFAIVYLAAIAFVLALDGRGFTELGPKGLRAAEVIEAGDEQEEIIADHLMLIRNMEKDMREINAVLNRAGRRLDEQDQRVQRLEEKGG